MRCYPSIICNACSCLWRENISALDYFNITSVIAPLYKIIQGPISWLIMFMIIKVIYTISPDKPLPSSKVNLGAAFTTIGWVLVTMFIDF